ncbi:5'-3' exonuclease PLD3 isoform X2 [Brachyhypopomus gauderio]|uniref:5'-3' exonuclease PLD3 isoform X2 n=1 Tax=Brachyhypopomus gauderio TaxID=698409 RepID=UPI004041D780
MESGDTRVGTAEHEGEKENEDKGIAEKKCEGEESRKTGRPTSRIPTFQSSSARKRTATQIVESSLPAKTEGCSQEILIKEGGVGSGEPLRTKLHVFGDKEKTLSVVSNPTQSSSTDDLSLANFPELASGASEETSLSLRQNMLLEPKTYAPRDSERLEESLQKPSLRAETESHMMESLSEPPLKYQTVNRKPISNDEHESDAGLLDEGPADPCLVTSEESFPALCVEMEPIEKQSLPENKHSLGEDCEMRHVKDTPSFFHSVEEPVKEDFGKQCATLTMTERTSHKSSHKISLKERDPVIPASSKADDSTQAEHSKSTSWTRKNGFALFCLVPSILLLLGGFGQHIWVYGVPKSVSHLMVQLELQWLEGFWLPQEECSKDCRLTLVESVPEGMLFSPDSPRLQSISDTWTSLLSRAHSSVSIAAFYLTLRDSDLNLTEPSAMQGKELFSQLKQLGSRGVKLKIAVNAPQTYRSDTDELSETGAEVREVNLQTLTGGIVHTKLWVVDRKHMYVGSANMDWRSLTQVKEVGVSVEDCSCLAQDALRIFGVYWEIGAQKNASLPYYWPGRFSALSSTKYPLAVKFNGVPARVYLSSSPPQLSAYGRSDDLSAILSVIADAKEFIHVSVMDYIPMSWFTQPIRFWPAIDSALREAACARGVEVNLLVSCWSHSPGAMFTFLQSLSVLSKKPLGCNIHVKVFEVPSTREQLHIPFARVNHAKYMVTDRVVYIGTSNWSENYFSQTSGVGLVVNQTGFEVKKDQQTVQNQLQQIFHRDWISAFAQTLSDEHAENCGKKKHDLL